MARVVRGASERRSMQNNGDALDPSPPSPRRLHYPHCLISKMCDRSRLPTNPDAGEVVFSHRHFGVAIRGSQGSTGTLRRDFGVLPEELTVQLGLVGGPGGTPAVLLVPNPRRI